MSVCLYWVWNSKEMDCTDDKFYFHFRKPKSREMLSKDIVKCEHSVKKKIRIKKMCSSCVFAP